MYTHPGIWGIQKGGAYVLSETNWLVSGAVKARRFTMRSVLRGLIPESICAGRGTEEEARGGKAAANGRLADLGQESS